MIFAQYFFLVFFLLCHRLFGQLLINGGYSESSNFSAHEVDIEFFNKTLFNNRGKILSAIGPKSPVVQINEDGEFVRDSLGWIVPAKSRLLDSLPASKENIARSIQSMVSADKYDSTIIFSDHGDEYGVALWNGQNFNRTDLLAATKANPGSKFVRTIHRSKASQP